MSSLDRPVLVLNKSWLRIRVVSVKRALTLVFADRASIVDEDNFTVYNWEEWTKVKPKENNFFIQTANSKIRVPEVIVLMSYDKVFSKDLRFTKRNIYLRDKHRCQYSGQQLSYDELDIDHVIPKSQGGKNDWDNVVLCSKKINRMKANRTPEQAGLKLIKKPTKPQGEVLLIDPKKALSSWAKFGVVVEEG